jgi:hypothetical protein
MVRIQQQPSSDTFPGADIGREIRGLENPLIDHLLMQPTYARLQAAIPFYTDPVLEAALARLRREEMPDLGGVRQPPPSANVEKRGLFARLFGRT